MAALNQGKLLLISILIERSFNFFCNPGKFFFGGV
jgi:hypothetical protein